MLEIDQANARNNPKHVSVKNGNLKTFVSYLNYDTVANSNFNMGNECLIGRLLVLESG